MSRLRATALLLQLLLTAAFAGGCRESVVNGWPHFVIEGTVTAADGAPVGAGTSVQLDIWQGPCVTGLPYQTATTTTGAAGVWSITVTIPSGSLAGCARVTAGGASASRSFAAGPNDRVQIDLQLPAAGAATGVAAAPGAQRTRIVADSIGPLPADRPLDELRRLRPDARDTIYMEHEAVFPALVFDMPGARALAVQTRMDHDRFEPIPLRGDCPADFWQVLGGDVMLGTIDLGMPWRELLREFGPAHVSAETPDVRVRFEYMLDWAFDLDADIDAVRDGGTAAIPAHARIWRVHVPTVYAVPDACAP